MLNAWSGLTYQGWLRMGTYGGEEERYRHLLREIGHLAPDVVGLNEANPLPRYARRLAGDLGWDEVHHPGLSGLRLGPLRLPVNLCEGEAILARPGLGLRFAGRAQLAGGPVRRHWSLNLGNATQVLRARIHGLDLYCTHWSVAVSAADYAKQEASRTRAAETHERARRWRERESRGTLAFLRPGPALLMGDLNAAPDSPEVQALRDAGWTEAATGPTWDPARNEHLRRHHPGGAPARVDYLFASPGVRIVEARVVLDREPHPSDHFGLLAEVEVLPPDPRSRPPSRR